MKLDQPVPRRQVLSGLAGLGATGLVGQGLAMVLPAVALAQKGRAGSQAGSSHINSTTKTVDAATANDFAKFVGQVFQVSLGAAGTVPIQLVHVREFVHQRATGKNAPPRPQFSLLFQAAAGVKLPQNTYLVANPMIGTFNLFLVPMGQNPLAPHLEAVFG
jgi:hypothetical protein